METFAIIESLVVLAWLVGVIACFLKGKAVLVGVSVGIGGVGFVGLIVGAVVLASAAHADLDQPTGLSVVFVTFLVAAVVGVFAPLAVGGFRLARPASWYARRNYDEEKMRRAVERFPSQSYSRPTQSNERREIDERVDELRHEAELKGREFRVVRESANELVYETRRPLGVWRRGWIDGSRDE